MSAVIPAIVHAPMKNTGTYGRHYSPGHPAHGKGVRPQPRSGEKPPGRSDHWSMRYPAEVCPSFDIT